ncbi:uncharacterized protein [Excalfactoria chinensis]|uniref:uncharacterized protein n=1 Tax=Excalfactoria chinensis TaxID=46218 RepID=UPI003B3B1A73
MPRGGLAGSPASAATASPRRGDSGPEGSPAELSPDREAYPPREDARRDGRPSSEPRGYRRAGGALRAAPLPPSPSVMWRLFSCFLCNNSNLPAAPPRRTARARSRAAERAGKCGSSRRTPLRAARRGNYGSRGARRRGRSARPRAALEERGVQLRAAAPPAPRRQEAGPRCGGGGSGWLVGRRLRSSPAARPLGFEMRAFGAAVPLPEAGSGL